MDEAQHGRARLVALVPVSRRGRVRVMWTIDRSADLRVCGEGATVECSHRHERCMRARSAWLGREVLCVGNDWAAAARTCGTPSTQRGYSACSQAYSAYSQGYSEYSQGVLRELKGGTLSTHIGYSAYSQRVLGALPGGTRRTHRGYSEYSQGDTLMWHAEPPDDGAGPTPLSAPTRRAYLCTLIRLVSERTRTRTVGCDRLPDPPISYWYIRM
jgi:hypothetical protein